MFCGLCRVEMGGDAGEKFDAGNEPGIPPVDMHPSRPNHPCRDHLPAIRQRLSGGAQTYVNAQNLPRHDRRAGRQLDAQTG